MKLREGPYVTDIEIPDSWKFRASAVAENMEAITLLILSGHYIGFLPEHYAAKWVAASKLQAVLPNRMHYTSQIKLLVRSSGTPSLAASLIVDDLLTAFRRCPGGAELANAPRKPVMDESRRKVHSKA